MTLSRRSGIIAALVTLTGSIVGRTQTTISGTNAQARQFFELDLGPINHPSTGEIDHEATAKLSEGQRRAGVVAMKPDPPPTPQGIRVVLGTRVVELTAEEIMDALEGKSVSK